MPASVIHARVPGRLRLHLSELIGNSELVAKLQREVLTHNAVITVSASNLTGNVLVHYRSSLNNDAMITVVEDALHVATASAAPSVTWWCDTIDQTLATLDVTPHGLSHAAVEERQQRYGRNVTHITDPFNPLVLLAQQLTSLPVMLLCASATLSVVTGGLLDAVLIGSVIAANVGIGFVTERNANRIIESFVKNEIHPAMVRRDGRYSEVAPADIVPGDLLVLLPGSVLPADARIIESNALTIDEAILTGESMPVVKRTGALPSSGLALAERVNMAYCGTVVTAGSGIAAVVAIGFSTEAGRINLAVAGTQPNATPMQRQIVQLGRQLTVASVVCSAAVFGLGWLYGVPLMDRIRHSTALAVAAIPEGLPTVATSILATGMQAMQRRGVLIRSLSAVETLGSVSVICFDKTGTVTRNEMRVAMITIAGEQFAVHDAAFSWRGQPITPTDHMALLELLQVATLCNESDAREGATAHVINGSSTENALLLAALCADIDVAALRERFPMVGITRRSETQRFMITTHVIDAQQVRAIKGDPIDVLGLCTTWRDLAGVHPLDELQIAQILSDNMMMAADGLRVLGFAYDQDDDQGPIWLGMIGMHDPARPEMIAVVRELHEAGIRTVMVTGDQVGTARAIAEDIALAPVTVTYDCATETGPLTEIATSIDVFARVSPLHKLAVVRALQQAGHIVAMIGDGINDGPALRAADIGVTLGIDGTDAARSVADVVLAKDELTTMIVAVRRGRTIYANLRKAIHFLVATNSSEVLLTMGATAVGLGQPLNTVQLLWINLVTDVAIAFSLGFEPAESNVMAQPPRATTERLIDAEDYRHLVMKGGVISTSAFAAHLYGLARHGQGGGGIAMMALIAAQLLDGFSSRSRTSRAWNMPRNRTLTYSILGLLGLQTMVGVLPATRRILGIAALDLLDIVVIAGGSIAPFLYNEVLGKNPAHNDP